MGESESMKLGLRLGLMVDNRLTMDPEYPAVKNRRAGDISECRYISWTEWTSELIARLAIELSIPMVSIDEEFKIAKVNGPYETLTGNTAFQIIGKPLASIVPGWKKEDHPVHETDWMASPEMVRTLNAANLIDIPTKSGGNKRVRILLFKLPVSSMMANAMLIDEAVIKEFIERAKNENSDKVHARTKTVTRAIGDLVSVFGGGAIGGIIFLTLFSILCLTFVASAFGAGYGYAWYSDEDQEKRVTNTAPVGKIAIQPERKKSSVGQISAVLRVWIATLGAHNIVLYEYNRHGPRPVAWAGERSPSVFSNENLSECGIKGDSIACPVLINGSNIGFLEAHFFDDISDSKADLFRRSAVINVMQVISNPGNDWQHPDDYKWKRGETNSKPKEIAAIEVVQ